MLLYGSTRDAELLFRSRPVDGDCGLRVVQAGLGLRPRRRADPPVERILHGVLRVRDRAGLGPQVAGVVRAAEFKADQMVQLPADMVLAVGGLGHLILELGGLRRRRPVGAGPVARGAEDCGSHRGVISTRRAGPVGQLPMVTKMTRASNGARDLAPVLRSE